MKFKKHTHKTPKQTTNSPKATKMQEHKRKHRKQNFRNQAKVLKTQIATNKYIKHSSPPLKK